VRLTKLDASGDGTVSREEWTAAFARLDKNGDGKLTADELQKKPGTKGAGKGKRNR
jgi:Ca2+-binding EF-hand superfamily protein